jgi:hypothetical protein
MQEWSFTLARSLDFFGNLAFRQFRQFLIGRFFFFQGFEEQSHRLFVA